MRLRDRSRFALGLACSGAIHLGAPSLFAVDLSEQEGRQEQRPAVVETPGEVVPMLLDASGGDAERATRSGDIPGMRKFEVALVHMTAPAEAVKPKMRRPRRLTQEKQGEPAVEPVVEAHDAQLSTERETSVEVEVGPASPFVPVGGGAGVLEGEGELARGDANDALVRARLSHVVAMFVGESAMRRHGQREARIRFRIDSHGYVQDFVLEKPTRVREFDDAIEIVLHLAEPFPVSARSYDVTLPFTTD